MYEKLHKFELTDIFLASGLALVTVGVGLEIRTKMSSSKEKMIKVAASPTVVQVYNKVTFDISGEVLKPGVYKLSMGSRISDALAVAGGLAVRADREWVEKNINRAKKISDGEKIFIPKKVEGQILGSAVGVPAQVQGSKIININSASVEELDKLDGIGPSLAQRIIDYRNKNSGFKDINEVKLVPGIGDKMYEKIKEKIEI